MNEHIIIGISIYSILLLIIFIIIIVLYKQSWRLSLKIFLIIGAIFLIFLITYLTIRRVKPVQIKSSKSIDMLQNLIPRKDDKEELIIAVCQEDLSWIDKQAKEYSKVTVYNKCGRDIKFSAPNVIVKDSPNIGSCDYAFLTYIIERYNNLPEFVEFTKGSAKGNHNYPSCLPCYSDNDLSLTQLRKLKKFGLSEHPFSNHPKHSDTFPWIPSKYSNFGKWLEDKQEDMNKLVDRGFCNIIFGGHFGTTREQIKRTPLKVYEALRKEQKYPREEVDHFIERLWRPLLCRPKYNLVIVAIFKNEAVAMREWLMHHISQGVEHFYLIDNGSTDDWQSQIKGLPVTVYTDKKKHKQAQHYNDYFLDIVKVTSKWVAIIDLDEFLYARDPYSDIPSFLRQVADDVSQILIRWKMFGSSGHIEQPQSITKGFHLRKAYPQNTQIPENLHVPRHTTKIMKLLEKETDPHSHLLTFHTKCIVRTLNIKGFRIHEHDVGGHGKIVLPPVTTEASLADSPIHLNHYAIQSLNWYNEVKVTRGDVNGARDDSVRNAKYFKEYDFKDMKDTELADRPKFTSIIPLKPSLESIRKSFTRITPEQWKGENVEQELIYKYILPNDTILEFGGNIGRSSIVACQLSGINGSLIISESDVKSREELAKNMRGGLCNFNIMPAFSNKPLYQKGWNTQDTPGDGFERIQTIPYSELALYSPTVIIVDCEGCFDDILHSGNIDLSMVHTIILEHDGNAEQNKRIQKNLSHKFERVECRERVEKENKCFWEVLQRRNKVDFAKKQNEHAHHCYY